MTFTGVVIGIIIVFIIFIWIKSLATRGKVDAGLYKNVAYVNWDSGYSCDIDIDYSNPAAIIRHDDETGKAYVLRKAGSMDRGDKKVWLTVWKKKEYHGWTFILDNMKSLAEDVVNDLIESKQKYMTLMSEKDHIEAELREYKSKFGAIKDREMGQTIDYVEKLKPISIKKR